MLKHGYKLSLSSALAKGQASTQASGLAVQSSEFKGVKAPPNPPDFVRGES